MRIKKATYAAAAAILLAAPATLTARIEGGFKADNIEINHVGKTLQVTADILLDSLSLGRDNQMFITPVAFRGDQELDETPMQTVVVNGRNMQYAWERGSLPKSLTAGLDITQVVRRHNGTSQKIEYIGRIPWEDWMYTEPVTVRFCADECGCGVPTDKGCADPIVVPPLIEVFDAPIVRQETHAMEVPVQIHEGKARVQFEVDSITLHDRPYICRNGQRIDNVKQLKVIRDSIDYALKDPNVEIAEIRIVGYASPESPFEHNSYLATGRSRALAEYIAKEYNLPADRTSYDAVPENWAEFREMVKDSIPMTDQQRRDLLALIDAPVYGPADYDAKERTLKTDKRFAQLYRDVILPIWFPKLRATKFYIKTKLKPLSADRLAEVALVSPEKMTVNQHIQAAEVYQPGTPEYDRIIDITVDTYPDSEEANTNAAVRHIIHGEYAEAERYLLKAGDSAEAENARGIVSVWRGDLLKARDHFRKASSLAEARSNAARLGD